LQEAVIAFLGYGCVDICLILVCIVVDVRGWNTDRRFILRYWVGSAWKLQITADQSR